MPRIMKSLNNISRCQSSYRTEKLSDTPAADLSPCHHTLVLTICRIPGRSQEELSRDICLNKSTITRALTQLEDRGYVTRTPSATDKRRLLVYPTEKMLSVLPLVRAVTNEWHDLISQDVSEEELAVFHSVLLKIEKSAKLALENGRGKEQ